MKKIHLKLKRKTKRFICLFVICISSILLFLLVKGIKKNLDLCSYDKDKIKNLNSEIDAINTHIDNIGKIKITDDMSNEDYEKIARNDLGLAKKNEIILIPDSKK